MTKSKVGEICEFLKGTEYLPGAGAALGTYHRAREIRDATAKRGSQSIEARLARVKKSVKNHAVTASITEPWGKSPSIKLAKKATGTELIL